MGSYFEIMKLYVICRRCGEKIYLDFDFSVNIRSNLPSFISVVCPQCGSHANFLSDQVYAESDAADATAGAIIGGLIGLCIGPEGALIGATLGGTIGASARDSDVKAMRRFNNS